MADRPAGLEGITLDAASCGYTLEKHCECDTALRAHSRMCCIDDMLVVDFTS